MTVEPLAAETQTTNPAELMDGVDENLWLEDIYGERPLAWAAEQSASTLARFASPGFDALTGRLLDVIDSDDRIPIVSRRGGFLYNFWRDRNHPRGLWRRTTLDSYRSDAIEWDVLLDVDALGAAEDTQWVFSGARLLPNDFGRALISLSPDGGDAVTVREFDLDSRSFVADGFIVPTAKSVFSWINRDTIYLGTDFGPGSMTDSSYPRTLRRLRRGQAVHEAELVHEVATTDLEVVGQHIHTPGFERDLVVEILDFYRSRTLLLVDDSLVLIEVPETADVSIHREWLLVQPREDWTVGGTTHSTGSLLAIPLDSFLAGERDFTVLFTPSESTALESWSWTNSALILTLLTNVSSRLLVLDPANGWASSQLAGVPALSTVRVIDTNPDGRNPDGTVSDSADEYWLHTTGFITPPAVLRGVITLGGDGGDSAGASTGDAELVRSSPAFFDTTGLEVQQHWAVSADGTRVPYFQVGAKALVADGSHPTLLSGYGGFQTSLLANYSGVIGRAWLERGGVYVLANIRGGGEFGPAWHTPP
ncbi:MAG: prolyl oligopeptidase [Glaciihabitans sp.]|nr:prolyl oligopeptidase [Glaciihabitans sp.]